MFSRGDILSILQSASSSTNSFSRLDYIESLTGAGVYASKHIENELCKFVAETEERSTISEVARKLNVDQKHIVRLLPRLSSDNWLQINYQIIPNKEYVKLRDFLHYALDHELVNVVIFCRDYELSTEAFEKLLSTDKHGKSSEYQWLNSERTLVCSDTLYKSREELLEDELSKSSTPRDLKVIENPGVYVFPYNIVLRMTNNLLREERLQGTLNGSIYTPKTIQESLQENTLAQFEREGIVNVKDLKRAGLDKSDLLIKKTVPSAKLLKSNLVTEHYMTRLEDAVMRGLDLYGYGSFKDETQRLAPEEEVILKTNFVNKQKRKKKFYEFGCMIVSPELIDRLSAAAVIHAENKAQTEWIARIERRPHDHSQAISWQDSLRFSNPSISIDVISHILESIRDKTAQAHESKLADLKDEYNRSMKNTLVDKVLMPLILYLRGVDQIKDEALKEALHSRLNVSFHEILMTELATLEGQLVDNEEDVHLVDVKFKAIVDIYEDGSKAPAVKNVDILQLLIELTRAIGLEIPTTDAIALHKQKMVSDILDQTIANENMLLLNVLSLLFADQAGLEGGLIRSEKTLNELIVPLLEELKPYVPDKDFDILYTASKDYNFDHSIDSDIIVQLRDIALRAI